MRKLLSSRVWVRWWDGESEWKEVHRWISIGIIIQCEVGLEMDGVKTYDVHARTWLTQALILLDYNDEITLVWKSDRVYSSSWMTCTPDMLLCHRNPLRSPLPHTDFQTVVSFHPTIVYAHGLCSQESTLNGLRRQLFCVSSVWEMKGVPQSSRNVALTHLGSFGRPCPISNNSPKSLRTLDPCTLWR